MKRDVRITILKSEVDQKLAEQYAVSGFERQHIWELEDIVSGIIFEIIMTLLRKWFDRRSKTITVTKPKNPLSISSAEGISFFVHILLFLYLPL